MNRRSSMYVLSPLTDRKKTPSGSAMLEVVHVDFFKVGASGPVWRATQHSDMYPALHRRKGDKRFLFVHNWVFPPLQAVIIGAVNPDAEWYQDPFSPQARVWRKLMEGDETVQKDLLKVIMSLEDA